MALTPASVLADYSSGIGTQGATLKVNTSDKRVGIGTTNPQGTLQVGTGITMGSGIITATAADFSGNVTVGGELTYEDVTNVDSVGVITARSGIEVGSGVTITTTNVNLADNGKIQLGDDNDLQIYHDENNSYIDDTGGGQLNIRGNTGVSLRNYSNSNQFINCYTDGTVELFYNNSKKFETITTGVKVTGALEVTQEYPSIRPTLDLNFAATKTLDRRITFTRDGVGTFTDELGIIKYASNNVPRFDHNPTTGESLGLLIEESRINKHIHYDFSSGWSFNNISPVSGISDPAGETNARNIRVSSHGISAFITDNTNLTSGTTYTQSFWAKRDPSSAYFAIQICPSTGFTEGYRTFDLSNGTLGSGDVAGNIVEYPNGWYRCSVTAQAASSGSGRMAIGIVNSSTSSRLEAVSLGTPGSDGVYIWGAQLEEGSFASSLIPTNGTSVTRGADNAGIKGTNFTDFYNATEGTLVSEHMGAGNDTVSPYIALLSDGTNSERIILMSDFAGYQVVVVNAGSNQAILDGGTPILNAKNKNATAFKKDDFALSLNGGTVATDNSGNISVVDQLWIGSRNGADSYMNNTIQSIKYYNKRLPNAQLQGLTA